MLCKVVPVVDCGIRPLTTQVLHGQMSWSKSHRHRFGGIELLHSSTYVQSIVHGFVCCSVLVSSAVLLAWKAGTVQ